MTVSQRIESIDPGQATYEDMITITDIPKGQFPAVTSNYMPDGGSTREITVDLFTLDQASGGTMGTNTNLYVRQNGETAVKVTVQRDGTVLADNTTTY